MPFFPPYVYTPSAEASYVVLVTPLGNLRLDKYWIWSGTITICVLIASLYLYYKLFLNREEKIGITRTRSTKKPAKRGTPEAKREEEARSALEASIERMGENSYYYAHQPRQTEDESAGDAVKKSMVSSYGWTDRKTSVNVYVTDDAVEDMKESQLKLQWTSDSLSMDLMVDADGTTAKSLVIPTLFSEIKDVTWKRKKNQLTLTLVKAHPAPWTSLNGAAKNMDEHIEYDESLFD